MDQFQKGIKFTTKTKTNSTMESKTWSWLTRLLTSESIQDADLSTESGSNPVGNVDTSIPQVIIMSEQTVSLPGAGNVALTTPLKISVKGNLPGHPTVKPNDLMRYLCRLVTPPNGIVLDPFMGSVSLVLSATQNILILQ